MAFGSLEGRYGPGGVYKPAEAYWLTMEENSIWTEQDGNYVNKGRTKYEEERSLPLSALEAQIRKYVAAMSAAPRPCPGTRSLSVREADFCLPRDGKRRGRVRL